MERDGDKEKEKAVIEWVEAVNESGKWGTWRYTKFGGTGSISKI